MCQVDMIIMFVFQLEEEHKKREILIAEFPLQKYLIVIKEGIEMKI